MKLTDEKIKQIIAMYNDNYPIQEIMDKFNIKNNRYLYEILNENNIKLRRPNKKSLLEMEAIALYKNGYRVLEIVKLLSVGRSTLSKWLRSNNVKLHSTRNRYIKSDRHGRPIPEPRYSFPLKKEAVKMFNEGKDIKEISEKLDVRRVTIKFWVKNQVNN